MKMRNFRKSVFLLFGVLSAGFNFAFADLGTDLDAIVNKESNNMQIGVYVENSTSGAVLYNNGGSHPMTPASTTKVFTAAAAYLYLSPTYHYVTEVDTVNPITSKVAVGNLYVVFSGDPTLTSSDVYQLIGQLKQQGITQVKGNVVVDDSLFTGPYYGLGWSQDDLAYCYGAPIGAAIINRNCMALSIVRAHGKVTPLIRQYTTQFPVQNNLRLVGPQALRTCVFQPSITGTNNVVLDGCLPRRGRWNIAFAIKNPSDYAAEVVASAFRHAGIRVTGQFVNGVTPNNATTLASHSSASLQTILSYMLKRSDDVYAGAVGKTLGSAYYGVGSYKSGVSAINAILTAHIGSTFQPVYLEDSSGLSVYNLVSPQQLVLVLDYMYHEPDLSSIFMSSMAISGQTGTLIGRLNRSPLLGHVYAKTGTLNGVSTLAGYVALPNQPVITFAIMMNGIEGGPGHAHYVQDLIVRAIANGA